jgi:anti-sigma B factor antagonist
VPGVDMQTSERPGYVVVTLRGEFDVTTTPDDVRALMAPSVSGPQIVVDLADLAFMDCGSLRELASARARSRRAGGDLVLVHPQPIVLRLLCLTDMINHWPVFTSVDEAFSGAGGAPAAPVTPEAAGGAAAPLARSGIMPSAMFRGGAAMRHARRLPGLVTAASRKRRDGAEHVLRARPSRLHPRAA